MMTMTVFVSIHKPLNSFTRDSMKKVSISLGKTNENENNEDDERESVFSCERKNRGRRGW